MKARTIVLLLLVTAITVCAQTAPPSQKVAPAPAATQAKPATTQAKPAAPSPFAKAPAAKPAAAQPAAKPVAAKPAPAPAKAAAAKPAAPAPAKAAAAKPAKPAVSKAAKPAAKPAKPAKPAVAKTKQPAAVAKAKPAKARRDPFVSPIVRADGSAMTCSTGKKCLAIDTIVLKGIVKSQVGMIAVVESSARKLSYFLRENDPVFNGYVVKITRDSVVFRENVMDSLGRQSTREVVKKVVAPVV